MEIQIIKDRTNPLLRRREVLLKINNKGTPSRIDVKNKLAAMLNSKPELIVIEQINALFGKQDTFGSASIYESEERLKQIAHKHLIERDASEAKEETASDSPAAEAIAEPETKPEKE